MVLKKTEDDVIDAVIAPKKQAIRDIFRVSVFKEEMQLAFAGMEDLMVAGFQQGNAVLNLFGDTESIIPPSSQFFQSATRVITSFAVDGISEETANQLRKVVVRGSSPQEVASLIRQSGTFKPSRARMIARTEGSHIMNRGQEIAWEESGVVEKKEWYSAMDERVCPWCESIDGEVADLGANFRNDGDTITAGGQTLDIYGDIPTPPIHPNCRCTLLPV